MAVVRFTGYRHGLLKVSLTKVFRNVGLTLDIAKGRTDALLRGESFDIDVEDIERATRLVERATEIGAICRVVTDE